MIRDSLRVSYDGATELRDRKNKAAWKIAERDAFLGRLQQEGCERLLEIGAGTGQDGLFFAGHGLQVVATDLSPGMVARCVAKGLDARVMDFAALEFEPASFDAVHAMNCLLHVPDGELAAVLAGIATVLRPGGLFFLGVYGGTSGAGPAEWDDHVPPRYFAWRTDEEIARFASEAFDVIDFHVVADGTDHRFQSLTLRRPG